MVVDRIHYNMDDRVCMFYVRVWRSFDLYVNVTVSVSEWQIATIQPIY